MFLRTLLILSCVLLIHTNGQTSYFENYGRNYNRGYGALTNPYQRIFGNEKVTIEVHYEALCPGCKDFDTKALKETVLELAPYLDINLHPYGHAKTIDRGMYIEFISQHGPEETYGNKLHACAIDILQNTTMAILFNSCLMEQPGQGSDDAAADGCGYALNVNSYAIKQCAKSYRGSQLLKAHGETCQLIDLKVVPTVLVNGRPARVDHFKEDVCNAFMYPPPECMY